MAELTIPYLESLSTAELLDIAAQYGMDIPADLERVFIIEELFYLAQEGSDHHDPEHHDAEHHDSRHEPKHGDTDGEHGEFNELTLLPKQYNVSTIETLIRDPLWAFVFWEIKTSDRELNENTEDFDGYCLRITPLDEDTLAPNTAASFIVTVDAEDRARYLGFPPEDGPCFKVELCMLNGENCTVLAESRPFTLPRLIEPNDHYVQAVYHNPLAQLSGVERFSLIHSEDRLIRWRGSDPEGKTAPAGTTAPAGMPAPAGKIEG